MIKFDQLFEELHLTQTGTYTYTYSSVTKQTTSSFTPTSTDSSACYNNSSVSDVTMVTSTSACPTGETGTITNYHYVTTDSSGKKTSSADQVLSNTCATTTASTDTSTISTVTDTPSDIISNATLRTSDTANLNKFTNHVKSLDSSKIKAESYNLNIIVDDMTSYDISAVSSAISAFQNKVKAVNGNTDIKLTLPTDLSKYSAMKGKKVSDKAFLKASMNNNGNVKITYTQVGTGINKNTTSSFIVPVLQNVSNVSNIMVQ